MELEDCAPASALTCRDRWLTLQRLRAAAGVEAAVLALGPDVSFNRASEVLFNWLLGGLGGRELLASPLDPKYEDCMVCICQSRSVVFCKRAVQEEIAARTAMWESRELVVPAAEEESDVDCYEARKISAFIDMVSLCSSVGFAVLQSDLKAQSDLKMLVERWPLVQAYGYDEYGKGFLTLKKSLANLEPYLQQSYGAWDLPTVLRTRANLPQFHKAWEAAVLVQDRHLQRGGDPSVLPVTQSLVDYYEYGRLSFTDEDVLDLRGESSEWTAGPHWLRDPAPRMLIGRDHTAEILKPAAVEEPISPAARGLVAGEPACHMIWEAVDPLTGVAAARTYSLGSPLLRGGDATSTKALLRMYTAAAGCCQYLLAPAGPLKAVAFLGLGRAPALERAALEFLLREFPDIVGAGRPCVPSVTCVTTDSAGMQLPAAASPQNGIAMLYIRVAISDPELGSVAYGDTVFCSCPSMLETTFMEISGALLEDLPAFAFWPGLWEREASERIQLGLESALGVGAPAVRCLAHRPGLCIPLETPKPFPDPLALGPAIDQEVRCWLAVNIAPGCASRPLVGRALCTAWTYKSGKIVVFSQRTGYMLLQVFPLTVTTEVVGSFTWVSVEEGSRAATGTMDSQRRLALSVEPETVMKWRILPLVADIAIEGIDGLQWIQHRGAGNAKDGFSKAIEEFLPNVDSFTVSVALSAEHSGRMAPGATQRAIGGKDEVTTTAGPRVLSCIWVSGLPGTGALALAVNIARMIGAPLIDLSAIIDPCADVGPLGGLLGVAPSVIETLRATFEGGDRQHQQVVLCDVRFAPAEVITVLTASPAFTEVCAGGVQIVSVLHPSIAYPWGGSLCHPLLLSRTLRGWVDCVVLQGHSLLADADIAAGDCQTLSLMRELRAVRGKSHAPLVNPTTFAVLEALSNAKQADLPLARALALPEVLPVESSAHMPSHLGTELHCVFLPCPGCPIELHAFRACCLERLALAAQEATPMATAGTSVHEGAALWRGLFCVEARVSGAVGAELWSLDPEALWEALRPGDGISGARGALSTHAMVLGVRGEMPPPAGLEAWMCPLRKEGNLGVAWWWCIERHAYGAQRAPEEVLRAQLEADLVKCRLRLPPIDLEPRTEADVSPEALDMLDAEVREEPLPSGLFFNGLQYMDADGRSYPHHPAFHGRLATLVASLDAERQARNAVLRDLSSALPTLNA